MEQLNFTDYPHKYKIAAENLVFKLLQEKTFTLQKQIFEDFCKHYSVVPNLWKEWAVTVHKATCDALPGDHRYYPECYRIMKKLYFQSINHFYVDTQIFETHQTIPDRPYRKLLSFPDFDKIRQFVDIFRFRHVILLEQVLTLPHLKLNEVLKLYEYYSDAPLNNTLLIQHENAKILYTKIMAARTDTQWLKLLLEAKDDDFIVENIEWKLSQNPCNKTIWTFYFEYFQTNCDIRILCLYQRYCRLFIEDIKTRENYAKKIVCFQKDGYDVETWINDLKEFYEYFKNENDEDHILNTLLETLSKNGDDILSPCKSYMERKGIAPEDNDARIFEKKSCKYFFKNVDTFTQNFSIPKAIIRYITFKNYPNIISYRTLIQTCKYFFGEKQVLPIWHLDVSPHIEDFFHRNSMYCGILDQDRQYSAKRKPPIFLNNKIWLEHSISLTAESKILDKVYQCNVKYLRIHFVDITLEEYEIMVKSGSLKELNVCYTNITTTKINENITLERLMKWLPNAYKISLVLTSQLLITPESAQILSQLKRNVKIEEFCISKLTDQFESNAFCKFIQDNITSKSLFDIDYMSPVNENYQSEMQAVVEKVLAPFNSNQLPEVKLRF